MSLQKGDPSAIRKRQSQGKSAGTHSFFYRLKKAKIVKTLAAFIGGGWLWLEFVHWILIDHYHFPEQLLDISFISLLSALFCVLIWRWFGEKAKGERGLKSRVVLVTSLILATLVGDALLVRKIVSGKKEEFLAPKFKNSVAVLPFVDISPSKDQEYFCDGITEQLINSLSNIKELKVPARTSAFFFKGKEQDIRKIGQALNVSNVLEGSVRKDANRLRITAQLINVADGYHLWSEQFDRELTDIFSIQDEIALAIADRLELNLLSTEKGRMTKHHTENKEAYDMYLRGRHFWYRRTPDGFSKSLECYQKALDIDPSYALAYIGIADTYLQMGWYDFISSEFTRLKARPAIEKALELDDQLAEAHSAAGTLKCDFEYNFDEAEREYQRSIALDPNYIHAHHWYSMFLTCMGRHEEARAEIGKALSLDPLSLIVNTASGGTYYSAKQYDKAVEALQKTLELDPNYYIPRIWLALAYTQKGMFADAINEIQRTEEATLGKSTFVTLNRANIYAISGKKEEAEALIRKLVQMRGEVYVSPATIATVLWSLGKVAESFEWLDKAYQARDHWLIYIKTNPDFDTLRQDPRAQELMKKIGLK
jgi:TolB-like protein/Tfp pilus assembly protein PilF